jgi:23S rRNA pseudouridine955/2504/2580 synthase
MSAVEMVEVKSFEEGMRLDRWFKARYPHIPFAKLQKIMRTGQIRVDGARAKGETRLLGGQIVRVPPLPDKDSDGDKTMPSYGGARDADRAFLKSITLFEDDDILVLNKPYGLAVQGGPGITRHVDGLLGALTDREGQKPRLVHRLDRDTSGVLVVAKTRRIAADLAATFRSRSARKIYWALVCGVPKPAQGRISTYLARDETPENERMKVAKHGEDGASHAITYYAVVERSAQKLAWLSLKPVTGRTHQLRAHTNHIRHPIVGDPKYFDVENWELPGGIQNRLHLLARRITLPHPRGGTLDVTAPLPPHMQQSWNLLGFETDQYDPGENAPEE